MTTQTSFGSPIRPLGSSRALLGRALPGLFPLLFACGIALGADKSGVSPNTISLPNGPGSVEGLGESFQPTLNTGTAKYALGLKPPPGVAGFVPSLLLTYEGGGGNGPLGYGWNLTLPSIQRRTDEGIPTYGENLGVDRVDRFINEAREELVPTSGGFYFCENEAAFVRYRQEGDHWEGTAPNGTRLEFGITANGRIENGDHIFCWLLERETDTRGNVIEYSYRSFPGDANLRQKYLAAVRYGPGAPPWTHFHFVVFEYEDRPDWFEDGRPGFLVRTGKRLKSILIGTQGIELPGHQAGDFDGDGTTDFLNRRYDLEYLQYAGEASHWSLLSKVTLVGADGATALPPAVFDYAVFDPPDTINASTNLWSSLDEPPMVMDNALVDLVDLNADGLPDVLKTEAGGGAHTAWMNRGPAPGETPAIQWGPPEPVDPGNGSAWNFDLASERTHLADMDGDGLADLVHKSADDTVFFFPNRGSVAWGERLDMTLQVAAPPAPFGEGDGDCGVRTADIDFDKRIDIIQSIDSGGGPGYRVWFNLGEQTYSAPFSIEPEGGFNLTLPGVQIADCNGDRVPDIVRIQPGAVNVAAGLGYGRFAPPLALALPDITLDEDQIAVARLIDINGDGLADLVLERAAPGECWYWLNLGNYTLSKRRTITGLPQAASTAAVRWADLNGNGTTDLVYADSLGAPRLQAVDLGQLLAGGLAPNTLTRIENGIGRVIRIDYAPSTQFALEDAAAGRPWPDPLPFPVTVVSQVTVSDSLGHEYVTGFRYHDGYYDAAEKQFRGFAEVEQIDVGDAAAPTLVIRSFFDTGRSFDAMKGRLLRTSTEAESGEVFARETTTWADPPRPLYVGTNGVIVRFAHRVSTTNEVLELGQGQARRIESEFEYDNYGNEVRIANYGIVEDGDRAAFNDERITATEFALNLDAWILRLPKRQEIMDETGAVISRSESFYDDPTFSGENLGIVTVGNLTMRREWIDPDDPTNLVASVRTRYDAFGNPIMLLDPLSDGTGDTSRGHVRELDYDDAFHTYPVRETIHVGAGNPPLVFEASYDAGLGTLIQSVDFNSHVTSYGYDTLGRLTSLVRQGDTPEHPTAEYEYALAVPVAGGGIVNYVETRLRDQLDIRVPKSEMYFISRQFLDGLGRALMTRTEAEPEPGGTAPRVAVSGAVLFNARRQPWSVLNPFFTRRTGSLKELLDFENIEAPGWRGQFHESGELVSLDLASAHQSRTVYDATLRVVRTFAPDGAYRRIHYFPLAVLTFDEVDTDAASSHFNTPTMQLTDGLGRLIQVDAFVGLNDDGTPSDTQVRWTTRYEFDLNDRLTKIIDAQNNVKELRYDGLRRRVWMNDPDAGISTNRYDAASNLIETIDAKGQRISYTYDGVNRMLTEDYHDEESPEFSYRRSPDISFHYDTPAGPVDQGDGTKATARNVKGTLAWVEDTSGEEHNSFDERGRLEWSVRRIPDSVLLSAGDPSVHLVSFRTAYAYDSMDRLVRMIYPDNDEVSYEYNARGRTERILGGPSGHILNGIAYLPSAQQERVDFGNGVRTTYAYDARLRLRGLLTRHAASATDLIHFAYDLDPVSNVRLIQDLRPASVLPAGDPRRNTQRFAYDDLYRLTQVDYNPPLPVPAPALAPNPSPGMQDSEPTHFIRYRYDRIGNMLAQTSNLVHEEKRKSVTDLGEMSYGGAGGAANRIGRQPGDSPGPHALTSISNPQSPNAARGYTYDANGNMIEMDGLRCTWDFRDRLVVAEDDTMRAEYRYDYTGRRILKRVVWKDEKAEAR